MSDGRRLLQAGVLVEGHGAGLRRSPDSQEPPKSLGLVSPPSLFVKQASAEASIYPPLVGSTLAARERGLRISESLTGRAERVPPWPLSQGELRARRQTGAGAGRGVHSDDL